MYYQRIRPMSPQRHRNDRGAALFVVVMVVTLLTAVGLFAARSTSLVDAATGYARQSAQTLALADYGVQLVASEMGQGRSQRVFQLMDLRNQYCPTYGNQPLTPTFQSQACYAFNYNQLEERIRLNTTNTYNLIEYQTPTSEGSLGPRFSSTAATFGLDGVLVVELFDPFEIANIEGESATKPSGREVTISSTAQVRPASTQLVNNNAATWCSTTADATAASLLSVRSQLIVPSL